MNREPTNLSHTDVVYYCVRALLSIINGIVLHLQKICTDSARCMVQTLQLQEKCKILYIMQESCKSILAGIVTHSIVYITTHHQLSISVCKLQHSNYVIIVCVI